MSMFESEKSRIAERIKEDIKKQGYIFNEVKIMLRNGHILRILNYDDMVSRDKINPQDAYVYIRTSWTWIKEAFRYPLLAMYKDLLNAYLSKLGFYYEDSIASATGLKYMAIAVGLYYEGYLAIELANLDTAVNNINLPKVVFEVLGDKIISGEKELTKYEYNKILGMFESQRPFTGHNISEVINILYYYYNKGNKSLVKEAARIVMDYDRIFNSYRVCYNMKTWDEVDCWSIKF